MLTVVHILFVEHVDCEAFVQLRISVDRTTESRSLGHNTSTNGDCVKIVDLQMELY